MKREQLDAAFPTVVRYMGVVLTVVLVAASIAGHGIELAAGYVAAGAMIVFKTVRDASKPPPKETDGDDEKWSHLP